MHYSCSRLYRALFTVLLALSLTACVPYRVLAEYEHHSSVEDFHDRNETNQLGVGVEVTLGRDCGAYCPTGEVFLDWELRNQVFGKNPVGTLRFKQPIYNHP